MNDIRFILASQSPRRRQLLALLGYPFEIVVPDVDEDVHLEAGPATYVLRTAQQKAEAVAQKLPVPSAALRSIIIAADTTVDLGGDILAKPVDAADASAMLHRLSARTHRVHTGVAVRLGDRTAADTITSLVTFTPLSAEMIEWYVATGEPLDKAGGYAVQGAGGVLVQRVQGSVSNVIGLPLHTVVRLAADLGVVLLG